MDNTKSSLWKDHTYVWLDYNGISSTSCSELTVLALVVHPEWVQLQLPLVLKTCPNLPIIWSWRVRHCASGDERVVSWWKGANYALQEPRNETVHTIYVVNNIKAFSWQTGFDKLKVLPVSFQMQDLASQTI